MCRPVLPTLALLLLAAPYAAAQEIPDTPRPVVVVQPPPGPPPFTNVKGFSGDYRIGPGDQIEIQVIGQETLTQTMRVSNTGEVSYQMLGRLKVEDQTGFEVEAQVAKILKDKQLVANPEVLVFVREYQAKPVYVSGAVVNAGEYVMTQELTAVDAILLAGGLRFNAADEALLHRRVSPEGRAASVSAITANPEVARPGTEIIRIDIKPLKQGHFTQASIRLQRGDVLVVPEQLMHPFYVVGEVVEPRNYFYLPGKTLTASQALSWAGGPLQTAKMSKGMLIRYDAAGNRTEKQVDYAAILDGRQSDFPIQPHDVIFIPGSASKTIYYGLLGLTDTMVMNAAFRVGRTYQLPDAPERPTPAQ